MSGVCPFYVLDTMKYGPSYMAAIEEERAKVMQRLGIIENIIRQTRNDCELDTNDVEDEWGWYSMVTRRNLKIWIPQVQRKLNGIESKIKERGGGFSEGQAQRLSIARALLRKSPILLLDEATSALDVATERKVLKNIMADTYPRTCIVTTHRPTVLNICTRVYAIREKKCQVLEKSEIERMIKDF